ncbi:MAG: Nif3-like dinuclear metal center hexameric protein [Sulfuricella sp.]|nr:Nif3-like dinuclear metal center hexameric protein [Sulfuricella sp.]
MLVHDLEKVIGQLLETDRFRDYCPNGLQVEGRREVRRIVGGVSASLELLKAAHQAGADTVLVHHGYFWKGEDARIVGIKKARLEWLLRHDLNLLAYHLPLDAHPQLGNNAQLASRLGLEIEGWFGEQNIAAYGRLLDPASLGQWTEKISAALGRQPLVLGDPNQTIRRVAWCSGGAQGYFEDALQLGVDVYLTGEVSEQHYHLARETGKAFVCAGHHATERYGVQALGGYLAAQCGVDFEYLEIANPI